MQAQSSAYSMSSCVLVGAQFDSGLEHEAPRSKKPHTPNSTECIYNGHAS